MADAASVTNGISLGFWGGGGALLSTLLLPISDVGVLPIGSLVFTSDAFLSFDTAAVELCSAKAAADAGTKGIGGPFIEEAADP